MSSMHDVDLVLLSGTMGTEALWEEVVPRLGVRPSCRCLRTDAARTVGDVAESVLARAPRRFALAGHSFGGIVAVEVLRRAPERVDRLALVSASARPASAPQRETWVTWADRLRQGDLEALVEEVTAVALGPAAAASVRDRAIAMGRAAGPEALLRQLDAQAERPDGRPVLAATTAPVLAIAGEADAVCPVALQEEAVGSAPQAVLVRLPDVGHLPPLEAPAAVAAALDTWLGIPLETATTPPHPEGDP